MQRLVVGDLDTSKLNLMPTWGVSFGLPQGGAGGGYPINPYGGESLVNPYPGYGAGSQGLNLGLVSVNPLVAIQVTKDSYGEKVVKPFVNLHVTPNNALVHKLGDLLAYKKQFLLGKPGGYYGGPPHYYPHGPPIHQKPFVPHYPSHGGGYGEVYPGNFHQHHHRPPTYNPHYPVSHGQGYYRDDNDYDSDYSNDYADYADDYYRNSKGNNTDTRTQKYQNNDYDSSENDWNPSNSGSVVPQVAKVAKNTDRGNADARPPGRVTFPERRKRDANQVDGRAQEVRAG